MSRIILTIAVLLAVSACAWAGPLALETAADFGVHYYAPMRADLTDAPAEALLAEPSYVGTPAYGSIELGNGEDSTFAFVVDSWISAERKFSSRVYIDCNNDEDLTNDGDGAWLTDNGRVVMTSVTPLVVYDQGRARYVRYPISMYHFVPVAGLPSYLSKKQLETAWEEAKEASYRATSVFYYRQGLREGEAVIDGTPVSILLVDDDSDGCFDDIVGGDRGALVVDRDLNGVLSSNTDSAEYYSGTEPFEFQGEGYVLAGASVTGDKVWFEKTDQEFEPKLYLEPGYPALDFEATDTDGKTFKLSDYKGKVVLLDFWASWCGPCIGEMPNVIAAYEKWHDQGFEIIGVSLDNTLEAMDGYIEKTDGMTWRQVCDEKGWDAEVSNLWRVRGIPAPFIIDQDGNIYGKVRGSQLEEALEELLGE